ncbi:MAG TPA: 50S ribosomal protein L29 [Chitinophagaceae bacterium]|nr:50S ribosomal protein L29 [Chitinophagaceae bacterium]
MATKNLRKQRSEYRSWDDTTIQDKINELELDLKKMSFGHAVNPLENPMILRTTRRSIAMLKTELASRKTL